MDERETKIRRVSEIDFCITWKDGSESIYTGLENALNVMKEEFEKYESKDL